MGCCWRCVLALRVGDWCLAKLGLPKVVAVVQIQLLAGLYVSCGKDFIHLWPVVEHIFVLYPAANRTFTILPARLPSFIYRHSKCWLRSASRYKFLLILIR